MSKKVALSLIITLAPLWAAAQETAANPGAARPSFEASLDYCSRYVWRGIALSSGSVLQPSAGLQYGGFSAAVWGNFALGREASRHQFNEVDYTLSYEKSWGALTLSPAVQVYTFPNQPGVSNTGELAVTLSYALGDFTLFTSQYVDFLEYDGAYFGLAGASYGHAVSPSVALSASLSCGWASDRFNEAYFGVQNSAFNVVGADLSLEWKPREGLTLRPHAGWSRIVAGELADQVQDRDLWVAGLFLSLDF
jgi:hypothetical protein